MLKIAICDDDVRELSRISDLLSRYKAEKKVVFKHDAFSNAGELLDAMKRQAYDVLLLDVLMPEISGLDAAHKIREFDPAVKIVFLTSSAEFAVESYAVAAHYYLLKPGTADELFPILDRIFLEQYKTAEALSIMLPSGLMRLPLGQVEFLEVYGKKLMFHMDDGNIKEIRGSINEYENRLLYKDSFIKVHRSYIINMEYIQSLNARELTTLAGKTVPVSRLLHNRVKEAYMQFLFAEKGLV